jgi:DNA-nicking Smr family endonuclease
MSKLPELSNDDIELFRRSVGPVEHIPQEQVIADTRKPRPVPEQTIKENSRVKQEMLSGAYEPSELEIGDELLFIRPGVQNQVLRKLRRGHFSVETELDLHGMTVDIAKQTLARFLATCTTHHFRCIRIIHGKGHGSKDKQPILKVKLNHWLQQRDEVLAFCSARPVDGGTGAVYVLLKRS